MSIDVSCPGCGAEFTTDDEFAGQKTACPECRHPIVIPSKEPAPKSGLAPPAAPTAPLQLEDEPPVRKAGSPPSPAAPAPGKEPPPGKRPAASEPAAPPDQPAPESEEAAAPLERRRRMRARMAEYFRIALAALVALTVLEIVRAGAAALLRRPPAALGGLWQGVVSVAGKVAETGVPPLPALAADAPAALLVGQFHAFALALLLAAMLLLAVRTLLQAKLLDAMYALSERWNDRALAGVTFHFMASLLLVGLLAWAASAAKSPEATDGLIAGLLGAWLIANCLAAYVAHLGSAREFPHLTGRIINDGLFGVGVIWFMAFSPEIKAPLSRIAVVSLAVMLNSAVAFTLSSRFLLENERTGRFGRRLGFVLLSLLAVAALAYLCMALEARPDLIAGR